jgi:cysteine desulfuration protein SufE
LEFAESMPPLPQRFQAEHENMEPVPECMTPVFIKSEVEDGRLRFYFDVPPESPTVRGYAAIMAEGMSGATPRQVLNVPNDFFHQMGLDQVLSSQRLNGMAAILAHMKRLAVSALEQGAA